MRRWRLLILTLSLLISLVPLNSSFAKGKPKPFYPPVPISVLGLTGNLNPGQGLILLVTGTQRDRCALLGSDGSQKPFALDPNGLAEYRYSSPRISGEYTYEFRCNSSGTLGFKVLVGPRVSGVGVTIPPFITGQPCPTQGDITDLFSGDKGICLTKTRGLKTSTTWSVITSKQVTPCFVEGQKIPLFSNNSYFLCYSDMGSPDFSFRKFIGDKQVR
jgi:hypothetical protein